MPLYEFRCVRCDDVIAVMRTIATRDDPERCAACGEVRQRSVCGPAVHLSAMSKVERADPRYDRMVDQAMRNTSSADPDRLLRTLKPFSGARDS
jgi:putative FmdB family regulatory protein